MSDDGRHEYDAEAIRQALATDPRVLEPELVVEIAGDRVIVTGVVPTGARRAAVDDVLSELAAGRRIDNRTEVADFPPPSTQERVG
jgi:hypothetical protein